MKDNRGITIITLVITIIVIILIASITIYSGMDTVNSVKIKQAKDATNAIYLALIANENIIPSGANDGTSIADCAEVNDRTLSDEDFELLGLDYTTENCKVVFDKISSGDNGNMIIYNFTYTDDLNKTYENLVYTRYIELSKINTKPEFDSSKKVNRPVISETNMLPINYSGDNVKNVYTENWYNYDKKVSKFATINYDGKTFVWIPRFAYKIQDFYIGKNYNNIPDTAIDIVFLREDTDYMSNNEVLPKGYTVHPAFDNGVTGFWIMSDVAGIQNSIANAVSASEINVNGTSISHLMKNSEYAATIFLMRYLGNNEISFGEREFVAAVCDTTINNFDEFSLDFSSPNYIRNARGQCLLDTPWNLKSDPVLPEALQYLIRDVNTGGEFYYEATNGATNAAYRIVISK